MAAELEWSSGPWLCFTADCFYTVLLVVPTSKCHVSVNTVHGELLTKKKSHLRLEGWPIMEFPVWFACFRSNVMHYNISALSLVPYLYRIPIWTSLDLHMSGHSMVLTIHAVIKRHIVFRHDSTVMPVAIYVSSLSTRGHSIWPMAC